MQLLSLHIKSAEKCLIFRSQTRAASEKHRPPSCQAEQSIAPRHPQKVYGGANPLTPVTMGSAGLHCLLREAADTVKTLPVQVSRLLLCKK